MKRVFVPLIAALLFAFGIARAQSPDDQYVQIYSLIQEADSLASQGQPNQALAKYLEARTNLERFQKAYSDWNSQVVNFRLSYLNSKISGLSEKSSGSAPPATTEAPKPAGTATAPSATAPAVSSPANAPAAAAQVPPASEAQLAALREQVRELQTERTLLEAKLKEALAAQPGAMDPRELAKAEEKIKSLQKQNDLLKVSLDQAKAKPAPPADVKGLDEAKKALADANRKLADQTQRTTALEAEKKLLQDKVEKMTQTSQGTSSLAASRRALEDANRQLADQKQLAAQLAAEKDALQARLQSAGASTDAVASLRAENDSLKKQITDLRAAAPTVAKLQSAAPAKPQTSAAAPLSQEDRARMQRDAVENRIRELSGNAPVTSPPVALPSATTAEPPQVAVQSSDSARIKELERERDDLRKKLDAAVKTANRRKSKGTAGRVDDLENQLSTLQARLDVFEARRVPYSPEELALFKAPEPTLSPPEQAGKKSVRELPPGTASLVAEAQRYFSAKRLDKAEEKYLEVLHKDDRNVYTLANLAAIQLEMGNTAEAEKHIQKAVSLAPNDAYSLSILGYLRFKQQKYDESLDALSRAAKLEPENAEIQNYLGLTLSQKGLRAPAEAALRKAIQLDPNYASAHNNLAVVYLNQQPPAVELARWHYQKALAAGHPRNPELERMFEAKKLAEGSK